MVKYIHSVILTAKIQDTMKVYIDNVYWIIKWGNLDVHVEIKYIFLQSFPSCCSCCCVSAPTERGYGGEDNDVRETLPGCSAGDHAHPRPQRQTGERTGHQGLAAPTGSIHILVI